VIEIFVEGLHWIGALELALGEVLDVGVILCEEEDDFLVVTMFEDDESVFAALKAGARGYVLKDADRGMLLRAIRAVAQGEALLGAPIARRVLEQFAQPSQIPVPAQPEKPSLLLDELTLRGLEVLRLIAQGLRNRENAQKLFISEKTVGNHVSNILPSCRSPTACRPSSALGRLGSERTSPRQRHDARIAFPKASIPYVAYLLSTTDGEIRQTGPRCSSR
jgi:FixJ family two-component response regulator